MDCANCGVVNETDRKFCKHCGGRLELLCPACGHADSPDSRFCGQCGTLLAAGLPTGDAPLPTPGTSAAGTERRLVSVLFVDLVGFTAFAEQRDAEDVRAILSRYFQAAADAITRHGGTVEKFIGDAVMAVWGTPVAFEDDAERAVRSALEIVDRVAALGAAVQLALEARAGVLTGEAVADLGAVDQGIVTGDLVNTASRLQAAARPGQVLIGERTQRAVASSIACTPVDALTLKGRSEPLPAWRAARVLSEMGGGNRGSAPEPPFVGRDDDLRLVKELLHATRREGRPRLLHVTGVAGIGKSRLVWELRKYLDGVTEEFFWHQGRCPAYGDGITFWALAEMVRGRARILDTDDPDTARAALASCLEEYVSDADERRWIAPRLSHLIGLGEPVGDREELFGAWRRFFERIAEQDTVVLVFEDLHWADPGLLDFVDSLLDWSRTSPIVVLSLARPELLERRPTWVTGPRNASVVHLNRLPDAAIGALVEGYVDGLPADGLARIVTRAEGVPMYAVETVRMLAGRGVLAQAEESYTSVGELGHELDVPETLQAVVAARLDILGDAERALVQDASVVGRSFTVAAVSAVAGRDPEGVEPQLRTLVRKEVLEQDADLRSAERGQYRFVQSVIQEVAYSTLSRAARRLKHLACADYVAGLDEEELAGVVAHHYLEAHRAGPVVGTSAGAGPGEDDILGRARTWLVRACDRALSLGSPEQALRYAREALALVPAVAGDAATADSAIDPTSDAPTGPAIEPAPARAALAERAGLNDRAGRAAMQAGDAGTGWTYMDAACADYRALGDVAAEARLVHTFRLLDDRMAGLVERQRDIEARLPADAITERVLMLSGLTYFACHSGDIDDALACSERAMALAQGLDGDQQAVREAVAARGFAAMMAGRHVEARLFMEAAVATARRTGSATAQMRALMNLGVAIAEDDPRGSLEAMLECAALAGSVGMRPTEGLALANASESAVDVGEWDVADHALEQFARLMALDRTDDGIDDDGALMTRAMLAAHRGDPGGAVKDLDALESGRGDQWASVMQRTWWLRVRSLCRYLDGDDEGAAADAAESLTIDPAGGNSAGSLWMAVNAGAALRDASRIRAALHATAGVRGEWTQRVHATGTALVAGLEGDAGAADAIAATLAAWAGADLPLDHAFATVSATYVLPAAVPPEDVGGARAYLESRQAVALLARLRPPAPPAPSAPSAPSALG